MFEDLSLVQMSFRVARPAGLCHRALAEAVAIGDTPGYLARDVKQFTEIVNEPFTPRATRVGHGTGPAPSRPSGHDRIQIDLAQQAGPNGNSVSLEAEMIKGVEARGRHALALAVYDKVHQFMRMGLGRVR